MSLGQPHYTSAPPGPDGSGFRFTALTPGLPQAVLREAEQIIGYEPPRNAPSRPSPAELDAFPAAFSYSELSDGSRLLARTVYTGADYSGRWGNFHAHAVHLAPGRYLPDRALPVSAWESPGWATATPESGAPSALAALPPSALLDPAGLVAFAVSREPWLAAVFTDLQRQAEDEAAPQVVLVERNSADVARWVALASAVLPRDDAHRLTFTTYSRRPHLAGQRIIGVLPDDAHGLAGSGRRYRVHDCAVPPAPDGPEPSLWAVAAARMWSAGAFDLLHHAHQLPGDPFTMRPRGGARAVRRYRAADAASHGSGAVGLRAPRRAGRRGSGPARPDPGGAPAGGGAAWPRPPLWPSCSHGWAATCGRRPPPRSPPVCWSPPSAPPIRYAPRAG